ELRLRSFQLIRSQKTTHARQIRDKLCIEWFPAKGYWIEAIDEITARLKLIGLEEELRDMNAIALGRITRAIVDSADPAIKPKVVRFAAKKIYVLLPHKEIRAIDRVGSVHRIVINNCHGRSCRHTKTGTG